MALFARKIELASTTDPQPLRSPTPEALARHVGCAWVTDSLQESEEVLAGAPDIPPSQVLREMGTDMYLPGTATAPNNLANVEAAIWKQLRLQRLSPNVAMMVLKAQLPSKVFPRANVFRHRPSAQLHTANNALMVRGYKHMTGTPPPPCPHGCAVGALGAGCWLLGPRPVFSLWANRGRLVVGAVGCLGEGSNAHVRDVHCADSPGTWRRLPSGAYRKALHPPCAMPPPNPHAKPGGGPRIRTDVDA